MRFLVVADEPEPCPYRPGQTMRLPLRFCVGAISPELFDQLLADGDRRTGVLFYRPRCPACTACEALRIPVKRFQPSRSQRRVLRRNEGSVRIERHAPTVSPEHLGLYQRHRTQRGLARTQEPGTEDEYRLFLVDSCVETWELRYFVRDRLVGVSILDFGRSAVSSVYHYFEPEESWRSLGVYSVLKELELCAALGLEWYYLGLFVEDCRHLNYKAGYHPHQRRIEGAWREFPEAG